MIEVKAPNSVPNNGYLLKWVFLAGSIDMGKAVDWQTQLTSLVADQNIVVLNPRRDDWDSSWKQDISDPQFSEQVNWEMDHMERADVIVYVFDPAGRAPITLLELGLHANQQTKTKLVVCPEGYWRRGNVQIVCHRNSIPMFDSIEQMLPSLLRALK